MNKETEKEIQKSFDELLQFWNNLSFERKKELIRFYYELGNKFDFNSSCFLKEPLPLTFLYYLNIMM